MPRERLYFCGALNGSIAIRPGESPADALQRAQDTLLELMSRHAKRLGGPDGLGPNLELEVDA